MYFDINQYGFSLQCWSDFSLFWGEVFWRNLEVCEVNSQQQIASNLRRFFSKKVANASPASPLNCKSPSQKKNPAMRDFSVILVLSLFTRGQKCFHFVTLGIAKDLLGRTELLDHSLVCSLLGQYALPINNQ